MKEYPDEWFPNYAEAYQDLTTPADFAQAFADNVDELRHQIQSLVDHFAKEHDIPSGMIDVQSRPDNVVDYKNPGPIASIAVEVAFEKRMEWHLG